jgi:hypothetical protein
LHLLSAILPYLFGTICSNISVIINPKFSTQFLVSCYLYYSNMLIISKGDALCALAS